jgi:hypothetical protein
VPPPAVPPLLADLPPPPLVVPPLLAVPLPLPPLPPPLLDALKHILFKKKYCKKYCKKYLSIQNLYSSLKILLYKFSFLLLV